MTPKLPRRALATLLGGALSATPISRARSDPPDTALADIESRNGGRLGVAALDTASGRRIAHRADERFPLCSTYKFLAAAAILAMTDRGELQLDRHVPYSQSDLLEYAPITRANLAAGFMTVDALCAAALEWSDNTAANLLLGLLGGPPGWTGFARAIGDTISRLDRTEPELNTAIPGDPRDTTTPDAMLADLHRLLLGDVLSRQSRSQLNAWMLGSKVTKTLLQAGLPPGWRVGDKSGAGDNATRNDIGIILPPNAPPILAAIYLTQSPQPPAARDQLIADTGRIIADTFTPRP